MKFNNTFYRNKVDWRYKMRKVGYFFSGFLPIIVATAIQSLATFFLMGIAMVSLLITKGSFSVDILLNMLTDSYFSTGIMVIYSITCIVLFGLYYYHACGGEYLPKPSKTFDILQILGIVVLIPGAQFACSYLIGIVSMVFPQWLKQYQDLIDSAGLTSDITIAMLCYSVILAPIGEELIFRGVTMRLARRALPFWLANIFQALMFGIFHMNWIQGIYAFALGLLLGYVCEKGGSIYYSLLMHILFNFWGTVLEQLLGNFGSTIFTALLMLLIMIVSLTLGLVLFSVGGKNKAARIKAKLFANIPTAQ